MFCSSAAAAGRVLYARNSLTRLAPTIITQNPKRSNWRFSYLRSHWPEPLTQQTINEFLRDINYFEEPKKYINIGLQDTTSAQQKTQANHDTDTSNVNISDHQVNTASTSLSADSRNLDDILSLLSEDTEPPALDFDDTLLDQKQLINLATSAGIYRDLFGKYTPDRDYIKFTPKQAENLDKLVPHYWITDQPFARVERKPKEPEPLYYFEPRVGISARFINDTTTGESQEQYAHTSYHGNIIPASEAIVKPSITLDGGRHLVNTSKNTSKLIKESQFNNWTPGQVTLANFDDKNERIYYTIALLNLDSLHANSSNLHWMVTNIDSTRSDGTDHEEVCSYLPVHGIRGFGYSRYVFLVFQHESKLDSSKFKISDYSLEKRAFDAREFIVQNRSVNMLPVGLSWFQTTWDVSSNKIFHDYLQMRAPVYELMQTKPVKKSMTNHKYPGKIPFNIFLDHNRDEKEINEQVLLERLKSIDPYDYKDQYVPPKVPPTVFVDENIPSWMNIVMFKKKNKIGYWRGLRPASATLPLNNNADLDYPLRPVTSSNKQPPGWHNTFVKSRKKLLKDLPYSKPLNEHTNTYIQDDHEIHLDRVKEMMKDLEVKKKQEKSKH